MTTKLNPGKPDGGETQKACAKPHVSFENEYLQCVLGEGHKGMHAAKSAFGGTLQWHDNLAPSPQPSVEATEPQETLSDFKLRRTQEIFAVARERSRPGSQHQSLPNSKMSLDELSVAAYRGLGESRPAPSGETRGTCDGYLRHAPHTEAEHKSNCLKPGLPRWEWKPLAPEATTKEQILGDCYWKTTPHVKDSHSEMCLRWEPVNPVAPGEAVGRHHKWAMIRHKYEAFSLPENPSAEEISQARNVIEQLKSDVSILRRERDQLHERNEELLEQRSGLATEQYLLESQVRELTAQNQELRGEKAKEIAAMMLPEEISRATQLAKLMYNADHFKLAYEDHLKICPGPPMLLPSCYIEQNKTIAELRDTVEKMQKVLEQMLASASPNPKEHPTMTVAWANARRELSDMRKGSL